MDFVKQKPIYMQIADLILENILSGDLQAGDKIQSVREMAASVEVNPNTVMRSFSYLQEQDIIFNQRGIGYFVADEALKKTKQIKKQFLIDHYLPELFKMMELLDMDLEDLKKVKPNGQSN